MSKKSPAPKTERRCAVCGAVSKFAGSVNQVQATDKMVKHYETEHPDRMSKCFDEYGRTWNEQYDATLKGLWNYKGQIEKLTAELKHVTDTRNSLAARLNAINHDPRAERLNVKRYEYIRLELDMGDLDELNQLSSIGFRCVAVVRCPHDNKNYALLERPIER